MPDKSVLLKMLVPNARELLVEAVKEDTTRALREEVEAIAGQDPYASYMK